MQLAITALSSISKNFLTDLLSATSNCECNIVEFRTSQLSKAAACYLLAEGEWNQIAKLETFLKNLNHHPDILIQTSRPAKNNQECDGIPYMLETLSLYRPDILHDLTRFLLSRNIHIDEVNALRYQSSYSQNMTYSIRMAIIIPAEVRILSLREELLEFCDHINLDAIFEPIKR